jgi:hypothetical protein
MESNVSRRRFLAMGAGAAGAALLGACRPAGGAPAATLPDLLLVETGDGLAVVRPGGSQLVGTAIATPDAATLHSAVPVDGGSTRLVTVETATGRQSANRVLTGRWEPRAVSADGVLVALMAPGGATQPYRPVARDRSTIVIADRDSIRKRLDLGGNYVPDAFTTDLTGLYVLEWLPAGAPEHYRVRLVDFGTGEPTQLWTRDKQPIPPGAEEEMRGEGRQAVYSPDRRFLYTLYTHQPAEGSVGSMSPAHGFIHALCLEQRWAYCVDLPEPFGQGPTAAHALSITPSGATLHVADLSSGRVAVVDTHELAVGWVRQIPMGAGTAYAASSGGDRLYLGIGSRILVVDPRSGALLATWNAGAEVRGVALSPDATRLFVGRGGSVAWRDASSGLPLGQVPVPGMTALHTVGRP